MIKLTLKDGSIRELEAPTAAAEVIKGIGMGLYKASCCVKLDGEVCDLRTVIDHDCTFEVMTFDSEEGKKTFWHTASHVLAQAVKHLYPEAKLAIGPAIDDGFYYDFDREGGFTPDDLEKLEAEMKKIVKENLALKPFVLPRDEAIKFMQEKGEPYKVELIEDLPEGETISFYQQGDFVDLCAGPHILYTKGIKAFKLTSIAGAYWRGSEKNKMLTRIYGTAFAKKEDLDIAGVMNVLNKKSGLEGISGLSSDFRDLTAGAKEGNKRAIAAIEVFCYRVAKYVGSYVAAMNGVDVIAFTAGIGENSGTVRSAVLKYLGYLGITVDEKANDTHGEEITISTPDSKVLVMVIPTNEELAIARETVALV